ncbi:hypothetical protein CDD80_3099 [Ophiocordyceps camponoti-rufipedis]|uniref:IBR domain-containing protein n=1 Tax=Ophiocordyceps camponoti-rufipedis TaxID=2004952 RepID=A0A2C5Z4U6_9HYPO|nr:hypothetical protein CDD80_3099 [Ophiocordyceps camponoti-rufipedis]
MDISELDADSARVMIGLLKLDIEEMRKTSKGKHRRGESPDSEIAIRTLEAELESLQTIVEDRSFSMSIARAISTDAHVIQRDRLEDAEAYNLEIAPDHRLQATTPGDLGESADSESQTHEPDDELLRKLEALYVGFPGEDELDEAESSSWATMRNRPKTPQPTAVCTSCGDRRIFYDVARCPCKHEYCRECLASLFQTSMTDESLFPPRCCNQPIDVELNRVFLPSSLVYAFKEKKIELETPNRTYCHVPTCSAFITVEHIKSDIGTCGRCGKQTATAVVDRDFDAPDDAHRAQLIEEAADYLIENHECNHDRWRGIGGHHRCEECFHWLPQFIYECRSRSSARTAAQLIGAGIFRTPASGPRPALPRNLLVELSRVSPNQVNLESLAQGLERDQQVLGHDLYYLSALEPI